MSANKILQAAAGNAGGESVYVDDVFSTYLYGAEGTNPTIQTGIDMSEDGGMVWIKNRDAAEFPSIVDTERTDGSLASWLATASTDGQSSGYSTGVSATFPTNGFTLSGTRDNLYNNSADFVSWNFKRQAGFFDIQTYSGDTSTSKQIAHDLGATPACILIKRTDDSVNWLVYHKDIPGSNGTGVGFLKLNRTDTDNVNSNAFPTQPTDTHFTVNANYGGMNASGASYVAYLFANDDQSFGDNGDESIIKCGSFSSGSSGSDTTVNLGWEPQWILFKNATGTGSPAWWMYDTMRGWTGSLGISGDKYLQANSTSAEGSITNYINVTATGFVMEGGAFATNNTFIYIAIRRPMKTAESASDVFDKTTTSQDSTAVQTNLDVVDLNLQKQTNGTTYWFVQNRLTGNVKYLRTNDTSIEGDYSTADPRGVFDTQGKVRAYTSDPNVIFSFKRARKFLDIVTYEGNDTLGRTLTHNLDAVPELAIFKRRDGYDNWVAANTNTSQAFYLQSNGAANSGLWTSRFGSSSAFTSSSITLGNTSNAYINEFGDYLAILFASVPGISKVGSYTGTASNLTVDCGFSNGVRFLIIKKTSDTGNWYTYKDINAGNDSHVFLDTTSAEVSADYVDSTSSGFTVAASATPLNASGASYIFYAVAL